MKLLMTVFLMLLMVGCSKKVKEMPTASYVEDYHRLVTIERVLPAEVPSAPGVSPGAALGTSSIAAAEAQVARAMAWERVIASALDSAKDECRAFIVDRGEKSERRRKWPAALMITGIVASTVVVPALAAGNAAAHASWIAGVGGLSGGAVATAKVLDSSGLSGGTDARERNAVAKVVREQSAIALDPTKLPDERIRAAIRIKAECLAPEVHVPTVEKG